jgi:hypothetical protein
MKQTGLFFAVLACVFVVALLLRNATSSSKLIYRKQISSSCTLSVYRYTDEKAKKLGIVEYGITFHSVMSGPGLVSLSKIRVAESQSELKLDCIEEESTGLVCVFDANGIVFVHDKKSQESWVVGHTIGDKGTGKEEWKSRIESIASKHSISPLYLEVISTDEQRYSL